MQLENYKKTRIVILCGGLFSYQSIGALAYEKYLSGIVIATQDQSVERSLQLECEQSNVPFLGIQNSGQVSMLEEWLTEINPVAVFSICFPYLIPESILNKIPAKFINFHTGPLPKYRGAMPIFEVLRREESETAITAHIMDGKYDNGNVIYAETIDITPDETFTSLAKKMAERCGLMTLNIAEMIEFGNELFSTPQIEDDARFYPFPNVQELYINWKEMTARSIISLIKSCNGWNNGAITRYKSSDVHLISVSPEPIATSSDAFPGTLLKLFEDGSGEIMCIGNEKIHVYNFGSDSGVFSFPFLIEMGINEKEVFTSYFFEGNENQQRHFAQ